MHDLITRNLCFFTKNVEIIHVLITRNLCSLTKSRQTWQRKFFYAIYLFAFTQFPPYATNEIGRPGAALARREIGHGDFFLITPLDKLNGTFKTREFLRNLYTAHIHVLYQQVHDMQTFSVDVIWYCRSDWGGRLAHSDADIVAKPAFIMYQSVYSHRDTRAGSDHCIN